MTPAPVRTVFFGSGAFAVPILDAVSTHPSLTLVAAIVPPARPVGRRAELAPVPVAVRAEQLGVPVVEIARVRDVEAQAVIRSLAPELAVLADFGQIVPPAVLDIPRLGFLNVHPSVLPRHRGATPIQATIAAGDATAGVSIIRMDAGLDTGPVLAKEAWPLDGTEDLPALERAAADRGAALLASILDGVVAGARPAIAQGEAGASMTRTLRREDGRLDPNVGAAALERRVRAYRPWPGTFLELEGGRLLVLAASVAPLRPGDQSGHLAEHDLGLALVCADGRLVLDAVQAPGGRPMPASAYRRGHPEVVGARVGRDAGSLESAVHHA